MGCFCQNALLQVSALLPNINASATVALPGMQIPLDLSQYLSAAGLPAAPWSPNPNWLNAPLPQVKLSAQAVATISAMASLRAQVLQQFGIDLLVPAQAPAMARIVATLNARLSAMANENVNLNNLNPAAWLQLAHLNAAIDQVTLAMQAGLLPPSPGMMMSLTVPGGIPMARWSGFLALLKALAPLIGATGQLNVSATDTAQLAAALRVLAKLSLPPLAAPELMASLTAALSASASLQSSLGLPASPFTLGFPAVQAQVQARLAALMPKLATCFGINTSGLSLAALAQQLLAMLPSLPLVPSSFATSAVVQAAAQMQAMAALTWQVPAMIPAVHIGLPVCALTSQLQAALGVNAVLPAPCGSGCDAAKLARALAA